MIDNSTRCISLVFALLALFIYLFFFKCLKFNFDGNLRKNRGISQHDQSEHCSEEFLHFDYFNSKPFKYSSYNSVFFDFDLITLHIF